MNLPIHLDLPTHFLEKEVREGYTVSTDMKKIWAVELDLLHEFLRVCKKHDIKFYAAGGTMLGAVRHHGMIPWDDDIDVMMFRSEYNRLCAIGPTEFSYPYFFQTEETDPGSYRGHAQLRNSETTGILKGELHQKKQINQGIFIDIFPLDNLPDSPDELEKCRNKLKVLKKKYKTYLRYTYPYKFHFRKNLCFIGYDFLCHHLITNSSARNKCELYYRQYDACLKSLESLNSLKVMMTPFVTDRWVWNRSCLQNVVMMPFEMLTLPVPDGYEEMLNVTYGEWNKFVVGTSVHGGVIFDTDIPYHQFLK